MADALSFKPIALIIENEDTQLHLLASQLETSGYEILATDSGQQGITLWSENQERARIVITDLAMEGVDGFEVIKTIREQEKLHTYIMALTALDDKGSLIRALEYGADDYVNKPVIQEELQLRLNGGERLLRLQDHTHLVGALAELAASRSGETSTHLQRTKMYCHLLATDLLRDEDSTGNVAQLADDIAAISVLHDIGKQGIADSLLGKRGRYTPKEYEIIKAHTTIGGEILMDLYRKTGSSYLLLGHEIALYHHERWDGAGYPSGLKGEAIPLAARIMCFADVFDALLSSRPYKDALSPAHADSYIVGERGKHFDPEIVDSYLRNRKKFLDIHYSLPQKANI